MMDMLPLAQPTLLCGNRAVIEAFSLDTAHHFGDALASQARLRYRVFVLDRGLRHSFFRDMEYDEFDTPAAVYLVWRDPHSIVRGLIRLLPTSMPYMLKQYWPFLCTERDLPATDEVWEATRICVDRTFDPRSRCRIFPELLCAVQEFALMNDIHAVIGVTRRHLMTHFIRSGIQWLGEPAEIEGQLEAALWVPTEHIRPTEHCEKYGVVRPVLSLEPLARNRAAA